MTKLTKEFMQDIISGNGFGVAPSAVAEMARLLLAGMEQEPVAWEVKGILCHTLAEANVYVGEPEPLYAAPQLPQTAAETTHSSVIAEQLAHVLSGMDVTDHQRAIISCAVDRLNKNAEKIQQKPACFTVPDALDYQGAKELFNYLMNEEETNATVSGWNACRAAMLQGDDGNSPVIPDGWVMVPKEATAEMINSAMRDNETCGLDEIYELMIAAAPQQEINK